MEKAKKRSGRIKTASSARVRGRSKQKLALETWAEGRFFPLAMLAQQIAITAGELADSLGDFTEPSKRGRLAQQIGGFRNWTRLYRSHRRVWGVGQELLPEDTFTPDRVVAELLAAYPGMWVVPSSDEVFRRLVRESSRLGAEIERRIRRLHARALRDQISGKDVDDVLKRRAGLPPELIFLCLVEVPCRMEFGVPPGVLFDKAIRGDFDALCKLVSIDSRVEHDERILRRVVAVREGSNLGRKKELARAEARKPRTFSRRRAKYILAGHLSYQAEAMDAGMRKAEKIAEAVGLRMRFPDVVLTSPEIRALYNAAAIDLGEDAMVDRDLPTSEDTLAREIRRTRKFWAEALGGQK